MINQFFQNDSLWEMNERLDRLVRVEWTIPTNQETILCPLKYWVQTLANNSNLTSCINTWSNHGALCWDLQTIFIFNIINNNQPWPLKIICFSLFDYCDANISTTAINFSCSWSGPRGGGLFSTKYSLLRSLNGWFSCLIVKIHIQMSWGWREHIQMMSFIITKYKQETCSCSVLWLQMSCQMGCKSFLLHSSTVFQNLLLGIRVSDQCFKMNVPLLLQHLMYYLLFVVFCAKSCEQLLILSLK